MQLQNVNISVDKDTNMVNDKEAHTLSKLHNLLTSNDHSGFINDNNIITIESMIKLKNLMSFSCIDYQNLNEEVLQSLRRIKTIIHLNLANSIVPYSLITKFKEELPSMKLALPNRDFTNK